MPARPAHAVALLALLPPELALARLPEPSAAGGAWPLGLIVLGVAVVFLVGWLMERRRRARGPA